MQNSSLMQEVDAFQRLPKNIFAYIFVDLTFVIFKTFSNCTNIHELQEDPKFFIIIICVNAFNDTILLLAEHHDCYFILYIIVITLIFGLNELQSKFLFV